MGRSLLVSKYEISFQIFLLFRLVHHLKYWKSVGQHFAFFETISHRAFRSNIPLAIVSHFDKMLFFWGANAPKINTYRFHYWHMKSRGRRDFHSTEFSTPRSG